MQEKAAEYGSCCHSAVSPTQPANRRHPLRACAWHWRRLEAGRGFSFFTERVASGKYGRPPCPGHDDCVCCGARSKPTMGSVHNLRILQVQCACRVRRNLRDAWTTDRRTWDQLGICTARDEADREGTLGASTSCLGWYQGSSCTTPAASTRYAPHTHQPTPHPRRVCWCHAAFTSLWRRASMRKEMVLMLLGSLGAEASRP